MLFLYQYSPSEQKLTKILYSFLFASRQINNYPTIYSLSLLYLRNLYYFSYFKMKFIDDMCNKIVSPSKIRYATHDLGSTYIQSGKRVDFTVLNYQRHHLQGSIYQSHINSQNQRICVLYLHSMNGSRLQSVSYVEEILKMGLFFCHFDFSGCGNSQGSSISFGANEKYDVLTVFEYLKSKHQISKFIVWGRSMGSACALKFCQLLENHYLRTLREQVIGVVLDSCFRSLAELVVEIGHKYTDIPQFLVKAGYFLVKGTLQEKGNFKIKDLQLSQIVNSIYIPALFLASKDDTTINYEHSQLLYDLYGAKTKRIYFFKGMHNQSRDSEYLNEVKKFIERIIKDHKLKSFQFKEFKTNKFQRFLENKKNYVLEKDQLDSHVQQCSCSFFNPPKLSTVSENSERGQQKRRKTENLCDNEKIRLSKLIGIQSRQSKTKNYANGKVNTSKQFSK